MMCTRCRTVYAWWLSSRPWRACVLYIQLDYRLPPSHLGNAQTSLALHSVWRRFRPKGKAKCFAGDVGSIGIAFIMLFALGRLIIQTEDLTYLVFLLLYGVDGVLNICHRIMLHENLDMEEM